MYRERKFKGRYVRMMYVALYIWMKSLLNVYSSMKNRAGHTSHYRCMMWHIFLM